MKDLVGHVDKVKEVTCHFFARKVPIDLLSLRFVFGSSTKEGMSIQFFYFFYLGEAPSQPSWPQRKHLSRTGCKMREY